MADIEIQGWVKPPTIDEARGFLGAVLHICVGGEVRRTGTPWFELFRCARVLTVRERTGAGTTCPRCGEPAAIAFEIAWEAGFDGEQSREICEHCIDGHVISGGELLSFHS